MVRRAAAHLPVCVIRPSIVIGHSVSGQTTAFNVLYAPLRLFVRHAGSATLPVRAGTAIDTVPVDWVARLALAALAGGRNGETYAAASGYDALTAGEMAGIAAEVFDIEPPRLLPAESSDEVVLQAAHAWGQLLGFRQGAALSVYTPYLVREARFDSWRGEHLMQLAGERVADPRLVMTRCFEYARATNFGRLRADSPRRGQRAGLDARSAVA
jgi:nucleoside-diphosphate-sugar epimerase